MLDTGKSASAAVHERSIRSSRRHVAPTASGKVDAASLIAKIKAGGGSATLTTVQGEPLTAKLNGKKVTITDVKGNTANVTIADVMQSNGVIHVVDKVLMP